MNCAKPKQKFFYFAASAKSAFCRQTIPQHCRSLCETHFGTRVPLRSTGASVSQLRNALRRGKGWFRNKSPIPQRISRLRSRFWHTSAISQHSDPHFAAAKLLRNGCEVPKCEKSQFHSRTPISTIFGHISITYLSSNYVYNILFESLGSHESIASNGARFGFETEKLWPFEDDCANHERKCRTPISATVWHNLITSWSSNYAYYISFQILGSQESSASNGTLFEGEMKKLWPFKDERAKLSGNFAAETLFGRMFPSCETTFWHTSAILQHSSPHFEAAIQLRNHLWATKPLLAHECHFAA